MSFNKNATKRLSIVAGVNRESHDITKIINKVVHDYLFKLIQQLTHIVSFSRKKTINVNDVQMLNSLLAHNNYVICPYDLDKLTRVVIKHKNIVDTIDCRNYSLYTLKRPFESLVRELVKKIDVDIRIGKNVISLLHTMTENHVIYIMNRASSYMIRENRDTLLPLDLETILEI